jgi:hypothetical protein
MTFAGTSANGQDAPEADSGRGASAGDQRHRSLHVQSIPYTVANPR